MSRTRTRGQLLERLKRYRKVSGNNNSADPKLRAFLDDGYGRIWSHLTGADAGFGTARRDITVAVATQNFVLPSQFMFLRMLVINPNTNRVFPRYGSDNLIEQSRIDRQVQDIGSRALYYQTEGPGLDWDDGTQAYVQYEQRIRFSYELPVSTVVRLTFIMQPPTLADTDGTYDDDAQDSTVMVDTIAEPLEEALIGYGRLWSSSRGDDKDYARAADGLREVADDYLKTRVARNQFDADSPDRYPGGGHLVGY